MDSEIATPYPVVLRPLRARAKYYYNVVLDEETLSVSDLDEMRCMGEGHDLPEIVGLGFTPQVADPETVQYLSNQPLSKEGSEHG